jgi:endothelin-converting enzyme/putative endopeptidase
MDEQAVEDGRAAMKPFLARIQAMKSKQELPAVLAELHLGGSEGFFRLRSNQDFADSTRVIAWAEVGGISLPDRDYYTRDDDKSKDIRAKFVEHVARTMELLGDAPDAARRESARILEIETALAKASLTRTERRDPYKIFHKMDLAGLQALTPGFDWTIYLRESAFPRSVRST